MGFVLTDTVILNELGHSRLQKQRWVKNEDALPFLQHGFWSSDTELNLTFDLGHPW